MSDETHPDDEETHPDDEAASSVRYPDVTVHLTGDDGNALSIIGSVRRALRRAGVTGADLDAFSDEAMSGDYDNVLRTAMAWVNVE